MKKEERKIKCELWIKGNPEEVSDILSRLAEKFTTVEAVCESFGKKAVVLT